MHFRQKIYFLNTICHLSPTYIMYLLDRQFMGSHAACLKTGWLIVPIHIYGIYLFCTIASVQRYKEYCEAMCGKSTSINFMKMNNFFKWFICFLVWCTVTFDMGASFSLEGINKSVIRCKEDIHWTLVFMFVVYINYICMITWIYIKRCHSCLLAIHVLAGKGVLVCNLYSAEFLA